MSLSAIQRLNPKVGYIAGWRGTELGLAKTSDGKLFVAQRQVKVTVGGCGG